MTRTRREFIRKGTALGVVSGSALDAARPAGTIPMPTPRAKALMALFGLKYPIFEACHGGATSPRLAAAVSNAGARSQLWPRQTKRGMPF